MLPTGSPSLTANRYPLPVTRQSYGQPLKTRNIQFGGVGDIVSAAIGAIDKSRPAELITSDVLGMLVPRTGVAAGFRGMDDARETLIREGAGVVCVAMLAGLSNQAMVHLLGNRVGVYNPHGTPGKAWIGAKNLRVFSELYDNSLDRGGNNLNQVRVRFVETVLSRLESGDRQLSLEGRLTNLKQLSASDAEKALERMVRDVHGDKVSSNILSDYKTWFKAGKADKLRTNFLKDGWGKLSAEGRQALTEYFEPKATTKLDQQAWDKIHHEKTGLSGDKLQRAFRKERLRLALAHFKNTDAEFGKKIDEIALNKNLTSVVNLMDDEGKKAMLSGRSRKDLLKEMKYFLEHYVDRAAFAVSHAKDGKALSKPLTWSEQQAGLRAKLFHDSAQGFMGKLFGKVFPKAEDGLVTATLKAKSAYTWVPITIAIIANGITTFLNNYVTQKKYGGKVFFPGEMASVSTQPAAPGKSWNGGMA